MSEPSKREQDDDGEKRYWLDDSRNVDKIVIALVLVCAGLFAADFFYHKHVHFAFEDWFGFFANAGPVTYGSGGCSDGGGCGDTGGEGCDSGCSPGGLGAGRGLVMVIFPLALAAMRRRRRD